MDDPGDAIVAFLDDHECQRRIYLGDGVYGGMGSDGMCWLVTHRSDDIVRGVGLHYIGLDESVAQALIAYLRREITRAAGTGDDE